MFDASVEQFTNAKKQKRVKDIMGNLNHPDEKDKITLLVNNYIDKIKKKDELTNRIEELQGQEKSFEDYKELHKVWEDQKAAAEQAAAEKKAAEEAEAAVKEAKNKEIEEKA